MLTLSPAAIGPAGFIVGMIVGATIWRARLCTFGAIEDGLMGGDWRRGKIFGLSLGIALILTQIAIATGVFDPRLSTYVPDRLAIAAIGFGALLFGFGMALVGTCAFGSLVRLGGGDLRSLIVLLLFGAVAYAMQRGVLAPLRIEAMGWIAVPMPGSSPGSVAGLLSHYDSTSLTLPFALALGAGLIALALRDRRLRKARRMLTGGVVLGLAIVTGWFVTQVFVDAFEAAVRTQSLTFVAPVGRALFGVLLSALDWADFGVGTVFGTVAGSFLAAWKADEFRWNAFDDQIEMRRHLMGAVLMGAGGVLAGGCTIGQGLTAGSLMALTWPVTVGGMIIGARFGIAHLVGESWRDVIGRTAD